MAAVFELALEQIHGKKCSQPLGQSCAPTELERWSVCTHNFTNEGNNNTTRVMQLLVMSIPPAPRDAWGVEGY